MNRKEIMRKQEIEEQQVKEYRRHTVFRAQPIRRYRTNTNCVNPTMMGGRFQSKISNLNAKNPFRPNR